MATGEDRPDDFIFVSFVIHISAVTVTTVVVFTLLSWYACRVLDHSNDVFLNQDQYIECFFWFRPCMVDETPAKSCRDHSRCICRFDVCAYQPGCGGVNHEGFEGIHDGD